MMLTDNIAARAEYLRYDFNKSNFSRVGGPTNVSPSNNVLRGGVSYRF
jgi:opacity protein-like surface antigen